VGRLDNKIAIVTGAAQGQGAAIATRFVSEGAQVVLGDVVDEPGKQLADELGDNAVYIHHDVTDEGSWDEAVRVARDSFGPPNVLINNAGVMKWAPLEETALDDYVVVIRVNQIGCFLGMRAVIGSMKEAGGGSIVNTASTAGLEGNAGSIAYSASKFAIRGMTKTAALELGKYNIRVNDVCPGGINTQMGNPLNQTEDEMNAIFRRFPLKRIGTPEEIAAMMVFLASDESSYCTGADFVVDGGYTIGKNPMRI
jgi:3alpha(or 20beta)-hydroxysteroid dehydrogenase